MACSPILDRIGSTAPSRIGLRNLLMCCGSGFWGGQRPSLAHYVTGMGPMDGATAAGGRSCCNPPDAVHNHSLLIMDSARSETAVVSSIWARFVIGDFGLRRRSLELD